MSCLIFCRSKTSSKSPTKSVKSPTKKGRGNEKYKSAEFVEDESSDEEDASETGSPPEKKGEDLSPAEISFVKMKLVALLLFASRDIDQNLPS